VSVRFRVVAVAFAIALAGCGSTVHNEAPTASSVAVSFKDSPAPLASLHAQANRLLGGGATAFKARIRALHGYPVVVNVWASWCDPCQAEFPIYQRVAVAFGKRVAFLGLDSKDSNGNARSFLRQYPVTYPSYTDPRGDTEAAINVIPEYPQTLYFNGNGTMVYDRAGSYASVASLERDIRTYLHVT
jgi:cytochrome c biogenesis protein CcmG, thiol:disulfide interchange protein DsbE